MRDIVDKVPKEHWTMPDKNGWTPLFVASIFNPVHRQGISRLLALRGVPVLHDDFRGGEDRPDYLEYRRQLLRWAPWAADRYRHGQLAPLRTTSMI